MGRLFAISDIHGCYDEFQEIIEAIELKKEDKLVILGDSVDRGDKSFDVVMKLREMKKDRNVIILKGNHEDMIISMLNKYSSMYEFNRSEHLDIYLRNGAWPVAERYYSETEETRKMFLLELMSYEQYHIHGNFLFVHAGVFPDIEIEKQREEDLLWIRKDFIEQKHNLPYIIIFGHTATQELGAENNTIWYDMKNRDKIGIDCSCVFGGKLSCLELTTMTEYYVSKKRSQG